MTGAVRMVTLFASVQAGNQGGQGGWARRSQAQVVCKNYNTREARIGFGGGGWVGPKGTSTTHSCVTICTHNIP